MSPSARQSRLGPPGARAFTTAVLLAALLACSLHAALASDLDVGVPLPDYRWGLTAATLWKAPDLATAEALLRGLGVTNLRPSVSWDTVQPTGPEDWDWSQVDADFTNYRSIGARPWLVIESGSAPWATDTSGIAAEYVETADSPPWILPRLDEPITTTEPYYVFVRELVTRYHDSVDAWLIDNEPSEPWTWSGDSDTYARMARLVAAAVHDADPDAIVALGAIPATTMSCMVVADRLDDPSQEEFIVSYASRVWGRPLTIDQIRGVFNTPAFRVWDRVNFYRQALSLLPLADALAGNVLGTPARGALAPEIAWSYQDQMLTHGGLVRPLIYTEMDPYLPDPTALAQETTQLMIGSLASGGVMGQSYLVFMDGGIDIREPDSGLVTDTLEPKPGYYAYQTLISQLHSAVSAVPLEAPSPVTGYGFTTTEGNTIYALWSPTPVEVDLSGLADSETITIVSMTGESLSVPTAWVPVDASPIYITVTVPVVVPAPVADFSASPAGGSAPLTVSFTDHSTGSPTSWSWAFGDGASSAARNPTHVYADAGSYTVSLTAANAGGQDTATRSDYITVTIPVVVPAPVADFSASPAGGSAPLTVSFTDHSTGSPTSWSWAFGDGGSSTARNPTHVYAGAGSYTVSLTATNAGGQDTVTRSDHITVTVPVVVPAPVADFSASPASGSAPLTVSFTDRSTGSPTSWSWAFGDGGSSAARSPTHVYTDAGSYTVRLTAANAGGQDTATRSDYITVAADHQQSFTDIPPDYWAYDAIQACSEAGIVAGYPDGTYRPRITVTRDQMAVYIARALAGGDANIPAAGPTGPFPDVPADHWAAKEIEYTRSRDIVQGYPDGLYHPADDLHRAEIAVFIARALAGGEDSVPQSDAAAFFPDVLPTGPWGWCYKHVQYAVAAGYIAGYPDGLYHPEDVCTRDQMAAMIARAFGLLQ